MIKFSVYENNREYTLTYLNEKDIQEKTNSYIEFGYELLVLPLEYKYDNSDYLLIIKTLALVRGDKIVYI